ncbi:hypothetical protein KVT40_000470 [Elsinoe batatas]|uniref:Uncharacterized protein n=1 Tax=Elsinoe batatas TaxID=2601811 RepID=A0A8K0LC49_9PEZI|nr:hypothetical protein KVT40_000470 [Elsinoe batatas]
MSTVGDDVSQHRTGEVRQTIERQERSGQDSATRQAAHQANGVSENNQGRRTTIKQEENEDDMNLDHIAPWIKKEESSDSPPIKREDSEQSRIADPDAWIKDTSEERRFRLFQTIDESLEEAAAHTPQLWSSPEKEKRYFDGEN